MEKVGEKANFPVKLIATPGGRALCPAKIDLFIWLEEE